MNAPRAFHWRLSSLDDATNKQLVADFVGVPYERELRNVREAAEKLTTMISGEEESDDEEEDSNDEADY